MKLETTKIGNKDCRIYTAEQPMALLIQPMGRHELKTIDREVELIAEGSGKMFVLAAFDIADWDMELTPWQDPSVSTIPEVGLRATNTLYYIDHTLLPWLCERFGDLPCILGGYSLSALFSLWAATQTDDFAGIGASSPSVWIKDWLGYAEQHPTRAADVYLSLGDKEELTKDRSIAQVGHNIRRYHQMLLGQLGDTHTTLVWNEGTHFYNGTQRTADGFTWCLNRLS